MLVIDPPTAPSCTAQFAAELLVPPVMMAVKDWSPPGRRVTNEGSIETTMGGGGGGGGSPPPPPPPPPPPQSVRTSRASRTRAPILVVMEASSSAHSGGPQRSLCGSVTALGPLVARF